MMDAINEPILAQAVSYRILRLNPANPEIIPVYHVHVYHSRLGTLAIGPHHRRK